ncbi:MAG: isoprenylcysteine carboxylmethyltransferase family protein [Pseudomonadota bacterium]
MAEMLANLRYGMVVFMIVVLPVVASFWFVIHGAIAIWKKRPAWQAYTVALFFIIATLTLVLSNMSAVIGDDLGQNLALMMAGAVIYLSSFRLSSVVRGHLNFRTFAGIPEIGNEDTALIESGPFKIIRHPRYLMVVISTIGWAMITNYSGAYVTAAVFFVCLFAIIKLEERELIARFGDAYRDYQTRVPMLIPTPKNIGRLFV